MSSGSAEASGGADAVRDSPYVGLTAYAEDDSDFFFGREREIGVVRGNLQGARLTLFYGESGVGKSSVLLAGVVGRMRAAVSENAEVLHEEFDDEAPFAVAVFRSWVDPPLAPLMDAIRTAASTALGGKELRRWSPEQSPIDCLREWTRNVQTIYVVLDQFEEYFLYHGQESGPGTFAETFPPIVNDVALPVHFIISMREDALAKLDRFKDVLPIYSNALRLGYLDEREAREAIEGPLDRYTERYGNGERFRADPELVSEVIRQIQTGRAHIGDSAAAARVEATDGRPGPIGTPLLQLVLTRLWEEERSLGSHVLRLETLQDRLRGTEEIVRTQLDRTLQGLTDEERSLAARSFRFLVTPSGSKIAHTAGDLAMYIDAPTDELRRVLAKLDAASIVRTIAPPPGHGGGSSRYEIAHDVLGPAVLEWAARERHEMEVRERAKEEAERHRTRFAHRLAAAMAIFVVAAGTLAALAWRARTEATSERDAAQANARVADALRQLTADPPAALRAVIGAVEGARTPTSESALRAALAQPHEVAVARHRGGLTSASLSPDGKLVATAGRDGAVRLWNARTAAAVRVLVEDTRPLVDVAFSPDGELVATTDTDGTVRIWDAQTGADRGFRRHTARVKALAFSADGRVLATAGPNETARLWNVETGEGIPLDGHASAVNSVAFSPDGQFVVTASEDGTARVWDAKTGDDRVVLRHRNVVTSAVFSPDGRRIVTASWDETAQVWDAANGDPLGTPLTHQEALRSADFAPDGALIVTASDDGAARVWDATSGEAIGVLVGHTAAVHTAAFSPDGRSVVTASVDGTMRLWAADANPSLRTFGRENGTAASVAFHPDGQLLATAGPGTAARLWNARTGKPGLPLHDGEALVNGVAFSPDGRLAGTAGDDRTAQIWNVRTGDPVRVLAGHRESVAGIAFSPDGQLVATASWDNTARVWNVGSGRELRVLPHGDAVNSVAFSPDGELIATASDDKTARVWDVGSGRELHVLPGHARKVNAVAFSPDGDLIASASDDGTARLWNARSGTGIRVLRGHTYFVKSVAFSPDGALLVTASFDSTARVWDVRTGTAVAVLQRHASPLTSVAFSPRGDLVATASDDGARIHACGTCPSIDVLRTRARALTGQPGERR
jgi:WD40 repeat protein